MHSELDELEEALISKANNSVPPHLMKQATIMIIARVSARNMQDIVVTKLNVNLYTHSLCSFSNGLSIYNPERLANQAAKSLVLALSSHQLFTVSFISCLCGAMLILSWRSHEMLGFLAVTSSYQSR